ncbi:MAG: sugar transferase [Candidatus Schekmanbacteria bacterium]|nr:MAG: sugar transferase [Candidatus Schekmanbacteria bacterium]
MYNISNIPIRKARLLGLLLFIFENFHLALLISFVFYLRHGDIIEFTPRWYLVPIFCTVYSICLYFLEFYNIEFSTTRLRILARILIVNIVGTCAIVMISYSFNLDIDKKFLLYWFVAFQIFYPIWRRVFYMIFRKPMMPENILIVGSDWSVEEIIRETQLVANPSYIIKGIITDIEDGPEEIEGVKVIRTRKALKEIVKEEEVDKIIVSIYKEMHKDLISQLLECRLMGIEIMELPNFYRRLTGKIPLRHFEEQWIVFSEGFENIRKPVLFKIKRLIDIIISIIGLILAAPLILIVMIAIKLDSPGPIFYVQERLGHNEKPFKLYKFRSMVKDAELHSGPVWASKNDSRISRVGKIIRPMRIDEIPQLINVLKGDMTFIGPRPERPFFVEKLKQQIPYYSLRFAVKPGITGWAQVKYRYGDSVEDALEKLQYDIYYIQNISFVLDIYIILKTIQVVLTGKER